MEAEYNGIWYTATVEKRVATGVWVRFQEDGSKALIENDEIATRMSGAGVEELGAVALPSPKRAKREALNPPVPSAPVPSLPVPKAPVANPPVAQAPVANPPMPSPLMPVTYLAGTRKSGHCIRITAMAINPTLTLPATWLTPYSWNW